MFTLENTKYELKGTKKFKKQLKKVVKQGKDISKLILVIGKLANGEELEQKYRDHSLIDDKFYSNCRECHIDSDWLLVYKYLENNLVLLMVDTGSHSNLFKK